MIRQLVNGELSQNISVSDRGLHYGDGLFETIVVKDAKIINLSDHLGRLQAGCKRLKLPALSIDTMVDECQLLLGNTTDGIIKIIITRGDSERGYRYCLDQIATRILILYPPKYFPSENYTQGVKLIVCRTRLGINPQFAGLKHLNRLEQVMARSEWSDSTISEGVMLDTRDRVIEGTMSNLFLVEKQRLISPDLTDCGVCGIQRQKIIEIAKILKIRQQIEIIPIPRLLCADEVFICNSVIGIWPVIAVDTQGYQLGPITGKLMNSLKKL